MQGGTNTKAEIIALLQGRPQEFLEYIHQLILDTDERDFTGFRSLGTA